MVICGVGTDVRAYRGAPLDVGEDRDEGIAELPILFQNYPNPFNPQTVIRFDLPAQRVESSTGQAGVPSGAERHGAGGAHLKFVSLTVYDLLGRVVATLVNEVLTSGSYERTFDGTRLASGVYVYRLNSGGFQQTRRLLLLK